MGFSPQWLALREPADHQARAKGLLAEVEKHFRSRSSVGVVDLGCGTGSNLRGAYAALPKVQDWTLVDYDPALLATARERLAAWADAAEPKGEGLALRKDGREISVAFLRADLTRDQDVALARAGDLVTAAALFDLVSAAWIKDFVKRLAKRRLPLYTVLTYDGTERWTPPHGADADMLAAFHAHQRRDKGFGPAAGPEATHEFVEAFKAAGYKPMTAASPWVLAGEHRQLCAEFARGFADAVIETGQVSATDVESWLAARLEGATCLVGHEDLFALPG